MSIPFADHFLAGSILSLLLPLGLLIAIAIWYTVGVRRMPGRDTSENLPPPPVGEPAPGEPPRGGA
jgi:hypothetical protein